MGFETTRRDISSVFDLFNVRLLWLMYSRQINLAFVFVGTVGLIFSSQEGVNSVCTKCSRLHTDVCRPV